MSLTERFIENFLLTDRLPYPKAVSMEPVGNMCQLKCPLCPVGARSLPQAGRLMSLETFKAVLDKLPFVRTIDLYKSGEPFLNPKLTAMIGYASARGIRVVVSTHFSFDRPAEFFEDIATSGLERLVISLDGASRESYSRYRVGGDYDLVMSNMQRLTATKTRLRSRKPEIVWQFLVNKFNEHEIATAQKIADSLKISLDLRPFCLSDDVPDVEFEGTIQERKAHWLPVNDKYIYHCYQGEYGYPLFGGICLQLFTGMVVTAEGKVLPCCEAWDDSSVFGDLLTESFEEIWYNRKYLDARARFFRKDFTPQAQSVCFRCNNFGVAPSLKDKLALLATVLRKNVWHWRT